MRGEKEGSVRYILRHVSQRFGRRQIRLAPFVFLFAIAVSIAIASPLVQTGFAQQAGQRNVTITLTSPLILSARASSVAGNGYAISDTAANQLIGNAARGGSVLAAQASDGSLSTTQGLPGNKAYLIFTQGQRANFLNRLPLLKDGSFENFVNPSFFYPLESDSRITIDLTYQNIQINGSDRLTPGSYSLLVRNAGVSDGKVVVQVARR